MLHERIAENQAPKSFLRSRGWLEGNTDRPLITTYDSDRQHSFEHLVYLRHLVEHASEEITET
jgi:hypothetical protein